MKLIATIWLFFRRLVCFSFAAFLAGGACLTIWRFFQGNIPLSNALYSVIALGVAAWVAWLGIYGAAMSSRVPFTVDAEASRQMHNIRKRRYGWRW